MDWIINTIGDGRSVTTEEIKEYSLNKTSKFISKNNEWTKLIKKEVEKRGYFDLTARKKSIGIIVLSVFMLIVSIPLIIISGGYGAISFIVFLILLFWASFSLYNRKTSFGRREHAKWKKFKDEIKSERREDLFTTYPMDKYFIYSLVLGIEDRKLYDYKNVIESNSYYYSPNSFFWFYFYTGMFNSKTGKNEFNSSIDSAFISALPSSGAGGGFSGGAGGAGGGGAGGF